MPTKPQRAPKPFHRLLPLLLILAATLPYVQALRFPFVNYDDNDYITDNAMIQQGLGGSTLRWAFTTGYATHWHPLTWVSHTIDWSVFGANAGGHHAVSIAMHAANTLLLFLMLRRLTGDVAPSACVALLFALHPLNVQSVVWLAERKNVLSTLFGWWCIYVYAGPPARRPHLILAGLLLALGLMSKAMLVTWPLLLLLVDWWPLGRLEIGGDGRRTSNAKSLAVSARAVAPLLIEKVPFALLAMASSVLTYLAMRSTGTLGVESSYPLGVRVANAVVSYATYLVKLVAPFGLAPFYPHPQDSLPIWKVFASAVLLVTLTAGAIALRTRKPYLLFGWLWYIVALLPVIGVVQAGEQAMGDRYAYVPFVGLFVAVIWGTRDLAEAFRVPIRVSVAAFAIFALMLSARTIDETRHWRSDIALWEHAIAVTDNNYIAHQNLGTAYRSAGRIDDARAQFLAALEIRPNHTRSLINIGTLLMEQGDLAGALGYLERAVDNEPTDPLAHLNFGMALFRAKRIDDALVHLSRSAELAPHDHRILNVVGSVYAQVGRAGEAERYFRDALRILPTYEKARINLERLTRRR